MVRFPTRDHGDSYLKLNGWKILVRYASHRFVDNVKKKQAGLYGQRLAVKNGTGKNSGLIWLEWNKEKNVISMSNVGRNIRICITRSYKYVLYLGLCLYWVYWM